MNSIAPAPVSAALPTSVLDDILGARDDVDDTQAEHRLGASALPAHGAIPKGRARSVLALVGAGLAGLLGGIDILLIVLLETLLRGTATDGFAVPGMGFAAWSADNGLEYGFGPAAVAILFSCTALGVAVGWLFIGAQRTKRVASSRA